MRGDTDAGIPDWTTVDDNPVSGSVREFLLTTLESRFAGVFSPYRQFLLERVADQLVLDIGMVEHDRDHMRSPAWLHAHVARAAKHAVGVDILADRIAELVEDGYDVRCVDATSDADLGERFDIAVIGDVIEHVNNPVALLQFAARHLKPGGYVLVKTPNPTYLMGLVGTLRDGTRMANAEHVSWVTPSLALEIGRRAGLDLFEYWHRRGTHASAVKRIANRGLERVLGDNELLAIDFVYAYRAPSRA